MFYAMSKNQIRTHIDDAVAKEPYFCPACHCRLRLKRGKIVSHHFAHEAGAHCDPWYRENGKTKWHQDMQAKFEPEEQEIVIWNADHSEYHIADAVKKMRDRKLVFEFQHSPISPDEFIERSQYYLNLGYTLVWVFDYATLTPPKRLFYLEDVFVDSRGSKVRQFFWPGKDRVKLFDQVDVRDFLLENKCNRGGNLVVYFYVSTGVGVYGYHQYNDETFAYTWGYRDPLQRKAVYLKADFFNHDELSEFYASVYDKEKFDMIYFST